MVLIEEPEEIACLTQAKDIGTFYVKTWILHENIKITLKQMNYNYCSKCNLN